MQPAAFRDECPEKPKEDLLTIGDLGLLLVQDSGTWCEFGPTDPRDLPTDEPGDDPRDADAPDGDDPRDADRPDGDDPRDADRSEEHTSELQSLMRISYAVFCLKKKKKK